jgi:hypothetical protein
MSILDNAERFQVLIKRNLWGIAIGGVCLFVGAKAITTVAQAGATPIIEAPCDTATDVAAVICATPKLTALQAEMAEAALRATKNYRFNLNAQRELERLAPQLVGMRNAAAGDDGVGLEDVMEHQRDFLTALDAPHNGETGRWVNALGTLTITENANGLFVQLAASEPARNDWTCDLRVSAKREMFRLTAIGLSPGSPLQGWTLRAHRDGALLRLEEIAPEGSDGERPYCKGGGGFEGLYFPAR